MTVLSPDTQAALLLSSKLGAQDEKPLTISEYNKLARQLLQRNLRPGDLLNSSVEGFSIASDRLKHLLGRGASLAIAVERWSQSGVRVLSRSDPTYPIALRAKLKSSAAPVLFCCGKLDILTADALCVVGSRDASTSGLAFAARLGRACANQNFIVVSGDARGVDREAMHAALDEGGRTVGVLAETLATAVLAKRNRDFILDGRLLLISPFDPSSRFTVAHAMERNRYLYALASAAVIVDSDIKGGTWSGAIENHKHRWTPAFVRISESARPGNQQLLANGLLPLVDLGDEIPALRSLIEIARNQDFDVVRAGELPFSEVGKPIQPTAAVPIDDATALYDFFLSRLLSVLEIGEMTAVAIAERFGLELGQAKRWLARAQGSGLVQLSADSGYLLRTAFEPLKPKN